jgi:hypothetical protein
MLQNGLDGLVKRELRGEIWGAKERQEAKRERWQQESTVWGVELAWSICVLIAFSTSCSCSVREVNDSKARCNVETVNCPRYAR